MFDQINNMPIELDHSQYAISVCALTYNNTKYVEQSSNRLQKMWGKILIDSKPYGFSGIDYYSREMGGGLLKKLIVFERHVPQHTLYEQKLQTIELEKTVGYKNERKRIQA